MAAPGKLTALFFAMAALGALNACSGQPAHLHGTPIAPPRPVAPFTLTDQAGRAFSFTQLRGRAVALYFGYAHCRDICPQTLKLLAAARRRAHLGAQIPAIVMITVDPRRDSPKALRRFFRRTGVHAIGLTGTGSALRPVYRQFGVWSGKHAGEIVHTDVVYLIGPKGRLREILDAGTPLAAIASDYKTIERGDPAAVH